MVNGLVLLMMLGVAMSAIMSSMYLVFRAMKTSECEWRKATIKMLSAIYLMLIGAMMLIMLFLVRW